MKSKTFSSQAPRIVTKTKVIKTIKLKIIYINPISHLHPHLIIKIITESINNRLSKITMKIGMID